ncbi:hypothetical protein [Halorussus salinus]|uniref:hypothetical protein n=1 Tax=Halorussus salinus TaxID=1364935 RepID=UPI001091BD66|nr:hypothetical protein [Halorussus salinus]
MTEFRFDCDICETVVSAATSRTLKDRATTHLDADHRDGLREDFTATYGGTACKNDCGYVFPTTVAEVAGFDCPGCSHDHFDAFARQYVYWRIETSG